MSLGSPSRHQSCCPPLRSSGRCGSSASGRRAGRVLNRDPVNTTCVQAIWYDIISRARAYFCESIYGAITYQMVVDDLQKYAGYRQEKDSLGNRRCVLAGDLFLLQHGQCVPVLAAAGPHAGDVLQDPPVERAAPREVFLGEGAHLPVLHCT